MQVITITYEHDSKGGPVKVISVKATEPVLHLPIPRIGMVVIKPDAFDLWKRRP